MRNNNNLTELDELKVARAKEHAEKYLRAHGYEIISHEVVEIPHLDHTGLFVNIVVSKDGEKQVHCQQVR